MLINEAHQHKSCAFIGYLCVTQIVCVIDHYPINYYNHLPLALTKLVVVGYRPWSRLLYVGWSFFNSANPYEINE